MKISHIIATATLAMAMGGLAAPAFAQATVEHTVHHEVTTSQNSPMRHETVAEHNTTVTHDGMGGGDHMIRHNVVAHNEHHVNRSWHSNRGHDRHCRTVWRHHHRVRQCW